jgi:two-component system response regulator AtoC
MARVLVVDDEPEYVQMLQEFLSEHGHQALGALSGAEALQQVKAERPHLILLDVRMPTMNGLEVLRRVREIDREVGVIMVTAVSEEETGRQALALGAFDYMVKPVDLAHLERTVSLYLTLASL